MPLSVPHSRDSLSPTAGICCGSGSIDMTAALTAVCRYVLLYFTYVTGYNCMYIQYCLYIIVCYLYCKAYTILLWPLVRSAALRGLKRAPSPELNMLRPASQEASEACNKSSSPLSLLSPLYLSRLWPPGGALPPGGLLRPPPVDHLTLRRLGELGRNAGAPTRSSRMKRGQLHCEDRTLRPFESAFYVT